MVARQQSLQIDHVPSRLNATRPNKPRLVRHRITSLYSEMNHERTQTANSFTRSFAGTTSGRITLPFSALSTCARGGPACPSSDGEGRRCCLLPRPAPAPFPARRGGGFPVGG